jgi:hypothetical protein
VVARSGKEVVTVGLFIHFGVRSKGMWCIQISIQNVNKFNAEV